MSFQHTIKQSLSFEGRGLHTGEQVNVEILPAEADTGIRFLVGASEKEVRAKVTNIGSTLRSTVLSDNGVQIHTVEHLLSALSAMNVDNAIIKISGEEVPILDGSALRFAEKIKEVGLESQCQEIKYFEPKEKIAYVDEETGAEYELIPQEELEIDVLISYESNEIGYQHAHYDERTDYMDDIAPSRTFVLLSELEKLANLGLIKGGDLDNAVIFADKVLSNEEINILAKKIGKKPFHYDGLGPLNTKLFYSNEPARHKLLDLLGDLSLLGMRIKGKVIARKPGHTGNVRFAKKLYEYYKENKSKLNIPVYNPTKKPLKNCEQIKEMLPHRFPFLLVDKIIELEENHIVGVKNVTINERFFQGHFPSNPVMPGVLIIEALAQTGGVLALSKTEDPYNWDTYFIKMDKTKFRKKVLPGDTILLHMELLRPIRRGICMMQGTAFVGADIVAEGELTAQIINRTKQ